MQQYFPLCLCEYRPLLEEPLFKMLESMKDLGRDREYDRLMKYFVVESETCVGVRDVSYGMYL